MTRLTGPEALAGEMRRHRPPPIHRAVKAYYRTLNQLEDKIAEYGDYKCPKCQQEKAMLEGEVELFRAAIARLENNIQRLEAQRARRA